MGKVNIGIYCYLTADVWRKVLQKCYLSSPLPNISFLSKPLNLIGCHGNLKAKFAKKYSKIISSEAIRGIKLKLCRNIYNSTHPLQKWCFYCHCFVFVAMATYSFYWLIFWLLLLSHCRYFDKSFSEIFIDWSSTKHILFVQTSWLVVMATKRLNLWK